ncbi:Qat anti-phage system TatD family nuclease QatD [Gudongella sp. DL1XJH-153]|uniref:Qat anti-phage system TatD family nuclease QatD n=1 Tax=Gudongella sp. DL1XJH-153 TaxID=3409804 RepID=UPI003BB5A20B
MKIFDLHCHVDLFPSMQQAAKESGNMDIQIFSVTTTPKAYEKEISLLRDYETIKLALGLHPQLVKERSCELDLVKKYLPDAKYIGEIGLDFNRQFYESKDKQLHVFDTIIRECAYHKGKIISIHSVKSAKQVLDILEKYKCCQTCKCILHWYSGEIKQLKRAIEMGCFFSINLKMLESDNGKMIIERIPIERILVESDAPFIHDANNMMSLKELMSDTIEKLLMQRADFSLEQLYENNIQLFND